MSGGIDSACCVHFLQSQGIITDAIFIDYGQAAAKREALAVEAIAKHLRITMRSIKISGFSPSGPGELVGRNALLVFTALFINSGRSGILGLGIHAGTPYYDCSESFIQSTAKLVAEHTDGRVSVLAPFINWTKRDIYEYFVSADLPIASTYSCEAGDEQPCGICASCRDRKALGC
jgi:7-cyano-7-deazaguanine synthase